jgi:hypothetical protein
MWHALYSKNAKKGQDTITELQLVAGEDGAGELSSLSLLSADCEKSIFVCFEKKTESNLLLSSYPPACNAICYTLFLCEVTGFTKVSV